MDTIENKKSRRCAILLMFLCWLVYTFANIGRMDYSASMVAIIEQTGAAKDSAGLVASFFFFAYGVGQLINGCLCHKYNTRIAVFCALVLAAVSNVALAVCPNVHIMKYLWLVNGAVQSVLWSSLVKLQSEYLSDKDINKSIILMSTTTAAGTFVAYGLSALFVAFASWQITFYIAGAMIFVAAFAWLFGVGYIQKTIPKFEIKQAEIPLNNNGKRSKSIYVALAFVCVFAIANGFIRDGVTTWVPSLLKETYDLAPSFSIILTLILPLISVTGAAVAQFIHKKLPNDILLCGLFNLLSGGAVGIIFWLYTKSLIVTIIMFALVACFMAAVNNIIASYIPFRMRTVGKSGRFAGIINTFCYVGSTVSSYCLGTMAENSGWNSVILLILILSLVVGVVATAFAPFWHKKISLLLSE